MRWSTTCSGSRTRRAPVRHGPASGRATGRRPRRAVPLPRRRADAADRGRVEPRRHLRGGGGRARADPAGPARHVGPFPVDHVGDRPDQETTVAEPVLDAPGRVHGLPRGAGRHPQRPLRRDAPRDPAWLSWTLAAVAPLPCPSARPCSRPRDAARQPGHGDRPAALGAAGDERHPVPPCHRGRADPVVARTDTMAGRSRGGGTPPRGPHPAGIAFTLHEYEHDPRAASTVSKPRPRWAWTPRACSRPDGDRRRASRGRHRPGLGPARPQGARARTRRQQGGDGRGRRGRRATGYVAGGIPLVGQKQATDRARARPRSGSGPFTSPGPARPGPQGSPRTTWCGPPEAVVTRSVGRSGQPHHR